MAREFVLLFRAQPPQVTAGVGTELGRLLKSRYGIEPLISCGCNGRMREMDAKGIEFHEQNRVMIVGWLLEGLDKWQATKDGSQATWDVLIPSLAKHLPQWAKKMQIERLLDEATAIARQNASNPSPAAKAA